MEYPLFESLAVNEGVILNIKYHEERYINSYKEYYKGMPKLGLLENIGIQIPKKGYYKLRIAYNKLTKNSELSSYMIKPIKRLKVVETTKLDYHLKYTNREVINKLSAMKAKCDDILIINNGMVSDTAIANLLFLKDGKWFTPSTPLLKGTQRTKLLYKGMISEQRILKADIANFDAFQIINAMRPFNDKTIQAIEYIIF